MNVAQGLDRYFRHHRAEGSSPKTLENHSLSIEQLIRYLAATGHSGDVEGLCADDLRGFIDALRDKDLTQVSVATKVRSVKVLGKWLAVEDYVGRAPFARVKQTKVDGTAKEAFMPEEVDRLLATCDRN